MAMPRLMGKSLDVEGDRHEFPTAALFRDSGPGLGIRDQFSVLGFRD